MAAGPIHGAPAAAAITEKTQHTWNATKLTATLRARGKVTVDTSAQIALATRDRGFSSNICTVPV